MLTTDTLRINFVKGKKTSGRLSARGTFLKLPDSIHNGKDSLQSPQSSHSTQCSRLFPPVSIGVNSSSSLNSLALSGRKGRNLVVPNLSSGSVSKAGQSLSRNHLSVGKAKVSLKDLLKTGSSQPKSGRLSSMGFSAAVSYGRQIALADKEEQSPYDSKGAIEGTPVYYQTNLKKSSSGRIALSPKRSPADMFAVRGRRYNETLALELPNKLNRFVEVSEFNTQTLPADETLGEVDATDESSVIELDFSSCQKDLVRDCETLVIETPTEESPLLDSSSQSSATLDDYQLTSAAINKFTICDCSSIMSGPEDDKTPHEMERYPACSPFDVSDAFIDMDTVVEIEINASDLDAKVISLSRQKEKSDSSVSDCQEAHNCPPGSADTTADRPSFFKARLEKTLASQFMCNLRQHNRRPNNLAGEM